MCTRMLCVRARMRVLSCMHLRACPCVCVSSGVYACVCMRMCVCACMSACTIQRFCLFRRNKKKGVVEYDGWSRHSVRRGVTVTYNKRYVTEGATIGDEDGN